MARELQIAFPVPDGLIVALPDLIAQHYAEAEKTAAKMRGYGPPTWELRKGSETPGCAAHNWVVTARYALLPTKPRR